jgi:hypothetical protein
MKFTNYKNRRPASQPCTVCNILLTKGIRLSRLDPVAGWQGSALRWFVFTCMALLALSGPVVAVAEMDQSGRATSNITLEFSGAAPLTLTEVSLDVGYQSARTDRSRGDDGGIPQYMADSTGISLGTPKLTMTGVTQPKANKLTGGWGEEETGSVSVAQIGDPVRVEVDGFPYAIALAVLGLLGLVSVARRDDNKLNS